MPTQLPDSKQGISAKVVTHHFVRSEIRTLHAGEAALYARLVARLKARPEFRKSKDREIGELVKNITFRLQTADLTINFKALNYFRTPNTWRTYAQMYELALRNVKQADGSSRKQMRLADNPLNPAATRDSADTKVTFGSNVNQPGMQGVSRFMQTGGLTAVGVNASGATEYAANNPHFNARTRQKFTALNYGRRPHGGSVQYGQSHFILKDSLKVNAIYYAGDTFYVPDATSRVTYGLLFGVAVHASDALLNDIINSCYRQVILPDTSNADLLVEGHVFDEIAFSSDIKEMCISQGDIVATTGGLLLKGEVDDAGLTKLREDIKTNARDFANRNRIRLVWMD